MDTYSFKKKSLSLRLWHVLSGVSILAILITVFLRNVALNAGANAKVIADQLAKEGIVVSPELAKSIARDIRNPVWEWHYYIGFFLLALALFRLLSYFTSKQKEINPISTLLKSGRLSTHLTKEAKNYAWVRMTYAFFYLSLAVAVTTGTLLYFKKEIGLERDFSHLIKEVHEFNMWFVLAFVAIHIVGVIIAEQKAESKGIVSGMINGGE